MPLSPSMKVTRLLQVAVFARAGFDHVLPPLRVVEMSAEGEDLERLRARARQIIQQARVQALANVCESGHRFEHSLQWPVVSLQASGSRFLPED